MQTLNEIWRVLKPSGELYVLDFGKPSTVQWRELARRIFHRGERVRDNIDDDLLTSSGMLDFLTSRRLANKIR